MSYALAFYVWYRNIAMSPKIPQLSGGGSVDGGEDYGYKALMETIDGLVMGRHTYEKTLTFAAWPYGSIPVVVLSSTQVHIPQHLAASVESMSCAPGELVRRLAGRGARHLYVDGGKMMQAFLDAGLLQQLIITRMPMLIGSGIPLFGPLTHDIRLRHIVTRQCANGLVQSTYEVIE
jgi:dihydrofolate reductase